MHDERSLAAARIITVAARLATIREHLIFIGGTVLPLLVDVDDRFFAPRITDDVDAVGVVATYAQSARLEAAVAAAGYTPAVRSRHKGRWVARDGSLFDLSFAGSFPGASGSVVDEIAVETAMPMHGQPSIRHVSPVGLFLMKCAAYRDRGQQRPADSKDLADLAILLVAANLPADTQETTERARAEVVTRSRWLRGLTYTHNALIAHFSDRHPKPPETAAELADEAMLTLQQLAQL